MINGDIMPKSFTLILLLLSISACAMEQTETFDFQNLHLDLQNVIVSLLHSPETLPEVKLNNDLKNLALVCKHFHTFTHKLLHLKKMEILNDIQQKLKASNINTDVLTNANINVQDEQGMTALMHAAFRGNIDLVHLMLNNGADFSIKDLEGKRALNWTSKALNDRNMIGIHHDILYLDEKMNKERSPEDIDDWYYFNSLSSSLEVITDEQATTINNLKEIYSILDKRSKALAAIKIKPDEEKKSQASKKCCLQ